MLIFDYFDVLLVDDEDDIHAVSKLALSDMSVYGVPLRVQSAKSGAEAKRLLANYSTASGHSWLAVGIIDVVMESDTAGLQLCQHIRGELHNYTTQLVVRTGQAGKAPERSVIDRFDISGYVNKVEATEDRLYSLVKSGVRQYLTYTVAEAHRNMNIALLATYTQNERRGAAVLSFLSQMFGAFTVNPEGKAVEGIHAHIAYVIDGRAYGAGEWNDEEHARRKISELRALPISSTGPNGMQLRQSGDYILLSDGRAPSVELVTRSNLTPMPEFFIASECDQMLVLHELLRTSVR